MKTMIFNVFNNTVVQIFEPEGNSSERY